MQEKRGRKWVIRILLFACLLILTKFILFKKSPHYYFNYFRHEYSTKIIDEGFKNANLKPFATLKLFYSSRRLRTEYKVDNIGGNFFGFVPLGILFPLLLVGKRTGLKTIGIIFLISLFFETVQLFTGLGSFDIDDLILNTAGGIFGLMLFRIFKEYY